MASYDHTGWPVDVDENGCWIWKGTRYKQTGYGRVRRTNFDQTAHRVVYEAIVGPIPKGLVIDHLCRVRACVNPEHLEPVTQAENMRRGELPTMKVHRTGICKRGHRLTPENINMHGGKPKCRSCIHLRRQELADA